MRERRPYFYRAQVEKVKAARDFMVSDLTVEHTIDELADRFDLPPTAFKTCFKGVYGLPPYAYLRTFRMERAAALLRETDLRVADIGLAVGYDSPSKSPPPSSRDRPNPHRPPTRPRKVRAT